IAPGPRNARRTHLLGAWAQRTMPLFSQSDSAAPHAARYVRAVRWQAIVSLLGSACVATALVRSRMGRNDDGNVILAAAGTGFTLVALPLEIRAQKNLSRAIWWYKSTLPSDRNARR